MNFNIITIFPEIFDSYINESILKRAQAKKAIKIKSIDLRLFTDNKHNKVDDKPYGGGAGMVLMAQPIIKALNALKLQNPKSKIILLSAKGKKWNQAMAKRYAKLDNITLICGRYEGVDERVKKLAPLIIGRGKIDEISIGDYVLTGGELPALVIVDSITRLLPNVLGNSESIIKESHSTKNELEHPQYTRPEVLEIKSKKYKVPKVLLSGNHQKIKSWREKHIKLVK